MWKDGAEKLAKQNTRRGLWGMRRLSGAGVHTWERGGAPASGRRAGGGAEREQAEGRAFKVGSHLPGVLLGSLFFPIRNR